MMRVRTLSAWLAVALGLCAGALGHDLWLSPSNFRPAPGGMVDVDLRLGDDYPGESFARRDSIIERFAVLGPDGGAEAPILGLDGRTPAGRFRTTVPGAYILAYRSKPSHVELEASKFESYLREKGLEKIIEARKTSGASQLPGREAFSRCAKSLLLCGEGPSDGYDRVAGLRLELVSRSDPATVRPKVPLEFELLFDSKPCAGVLVIATCVDEPTLRIEARTNADGDVTLAPTRAGTWVLNAVEMIPATNDAKADWESLWASLSLRVEEPAPAAAKTESTEPRGDAESIRAK